MKKIIAASKAKKKEPIIHKGDYDVPLAKQNNGLSYLDKATIAALHDINVSVRYQGSHVYLVHHKGYKHEHVFALPRQEDFNIVMKQQLKVDISPFIVKHRQANCFTCSIASKSCVDPKTCGKVGDTNQLRHN